MAMSKKLFQNDSITGNSLIGFEIKGTFKKKEDEWHEWKNENEEWTSLLFPPWIKGVEGSSLYWEGVDPADELKLRERTPTIWRKENRNYRQIEDVQQEPIHLLNHSLKHHPSVAYFALHDDFDDDDLLMVIYFFQTHQF